MKRACCVTGTLLPQNLTLRGRLMQNCHQVYMQNCSRPCYCASTPTDTGRKEPKVLTSYEKQETLSTQGGTCLVVCQLTKTGGLTASCAAHVVRSGMVTQPSLTTMRRTLMPPSGGDAAIMVRPGLRIAATGHKR